MKSHIYTGIDLVEIKRFINLNPTIRKRFFDRVFTKDEQQYICDNYSHAAGIFAAKEAIAKVLGCGIGPISWQDIQISHTPENQPKVKLINKAEEYANALNIFQWSISITHTKQTAAAVAIAAAEK